MEDSRQKQCDQGCTFRVRDINRAFRSHERKSGSEKCTEDEDDEVPDSSEGSSIPRYMFACNFVWSCHAVVDEMCEVWAVFRSGLGVAVWKGRETYIK